MRKLAEEAYVVEFIKNKRICDRGIGGGKLWQMYRQTFGSEHAVGYNRFYGIVEEVRPEGAQAPQTSQDHELRP